MKTESIETAQETLPQVCARLGITATFTAPQGLVKDDWACIRYGVTLKRGERVIWEGPYHLGIGHVKNPKRFEDYPSGISKDEMYGLNTYRMNPSATLKDKSLAASIAGKLAIAQKVQPKVSDILSSLILDGSPFFDAYTFEDWAGEFGYDTDSRKAETMYKECIETGMKIARAFTAPELTELREAASNY